MNLKIGNVQIGSDSARVFVIAEIGNNHNGDFDRAIQMIDLAAEMGADCAKFQMRNMSQVYRAGSLKKSGDDLATEYTLDLLEKFELTSEQHFQLAAHCKKKGIQYLCTPWDTESIKVLTKIGVEAFKVASADLTNLLLLEALAATKKPLILSTGMSREEEIKKTIAFLEEKKTDFAILHCNSTYPAPFHNINLKYIERLKTLHPLVGYSGHERGISVSLAAVGLGAKIIERHFTLDRNMEGPDHAASLNYDDFKSLISGIRELELALGNGAKKILSQGELMNRENLGKSVIASRDLKKGHILTSSDLLVRSPGMGLSPQKMDALLGKVLTRDMKNEDYFFESDITGPIQHAKTYKFRRPWGVPVRYHDFQFYSENCQPDLFEFHLSYSDMDLNPGDFLKKRYEQQVVVHAPELFAGGHMMDLASPDPAYRAHSIKETARVIEITRKLQDYFPNTAKPIIISNIGGFSMDQKIDEATKKEYYEIFHDSLKKMDLEGVEFTVQTTAPYPWHFGGQRYQNLFLLPEEIAHYCRLFDIKMTFDISHSKLMCNLYKIDLVQDYARLILPFTAHLHLVDAIGVDGEGVQIDEGEIDFKALARLADTLAPKASFIPEIWQGHKNNGEGCWIALKRLQKYF